MSKICLKCGKNNTDLNSFCDNCKSPFEKSIPNKVIFKEKEEFIKAVRNGDKDILPRMWIGYTLVIFGFIYEIYLTTFKPNIYACENVRRAG